VISEAWKATKSNTVCCTCSNHLTNFYFNGKGTARTQSPTTKNCAPELLAFGVIAKVSPDSVQCLGLTPDEQPVGSLLRLCQVSMKVSTSIEDLQWLSDTESLDLEIPSRFRLLVLPLQSNFWSHIPFFSWPIDIQVHLITLLRMIINLFKITYSSSTAIPRRTYPVSSAPGSQAVRTCPKSLSPSPSWTSNWKVKVRQPPQNKDSSSVYITSLLSVQCQ